MASIAGGLGFCGIARKGFRVLLPAMITGYRYSRFLAKARFNIYNHPQISNPEKYCMWEDLWLEIPALCQRY